ATRYSPCTAGAKMNGLRLVPRQGRTPMDPAQAPTLEPRPPTGITATPPAPPVAPPVVPSLPLGISPEPSPLLAAWPRSAQLATAFLLGVAATLLIVHCFYAAG